MGQLAERSTITSSAIATFIINSNNSSLVDREDRQLMEVAACHVASWVKAIVKVGYHGDDKLVAFGQDLGGFEGSLY